MEIQISTFKNLYFCAQAFYRYLFDFKIQYQVEDIERQINSKPSLPKRCRRSH